MWQVKIWRFLLKPLYLCTKFVINKIISYKINLFIMILFIDPARKFYWHEIKFGARTPKQPSSGHQNNCVSGTKFKENKTIDQRGPFDRCSSSECLPCLLCVLLCNCGGIISFTISAFFTQTQLRWDFFHANGQNFEYVISANFCERWLRSPVLTTLAQYWYSGPHRRLSLSLLKFASF